MLTETSVFTIEDKGSEVVILNKTTSQKTILNPFYAPMFSTFLNDILFSMAQSGSHIHNSINELCENFIT